MRCDASYLNLVFVSGKAHKKEHRELRTNYCTTQTDTQAYREKESKANSGHTHTNTKYNINY